jgi:hypothetical protein
MTSGCEINVKNTAHETPINDPYQTDSVSQLFPDRLMNVLAIWQFFPMTAQAVRISGSVALLAVGAVGFLRGLFITAAFRRIMAN